MNSTNERIQIVNSKIYEFQNFLDKAPFTLFNLKPNENK